MIIIIFTIIFVFPLFSQENCFSESSVLTRSIYNVGETLSEDDQNILFPVCNGSGNYETGDSFSFADLNGNLNGGDYNVIVITMAASW